MASGDEQAPTTLDSDVPASAERVISKRDPDVIPGPVLVRGSLDKPVIRRTIRGHLEELRACYLPVLKKKPELSGRISIQFTISAAGKVVDSVLQSSSLQDALVEKCVVKAFHGWEFPKPQGGGSVVVTHDVEFLAGWPGERHVGERHVGR
jgi:TonB family protein